MFCEQEKDGYDHHKKIEQKIDDIGSPTACLVVKKETSRPRKIGKSLA